MIYHGRGVYLNFYFVEAGSRLLLGRYSPSLSLSLCYAFGVIVIAEAVSHECNSS